METYLGLRELALEAVSSGIVQVSSDHPRALGVVVDIPADGGFVTIVAMSDATTSMYTSTGGGTIGAGDHAVVAAATHRLLAAVEDHRGLFEEGEDTGLPAPGYVRFHVLGPTPSRADVEEAAFWGERPDPLTPVIAATQDVISTIRTV